MLGNDLGDLIAFAKKLTNKTPQTDKFAVRGFEKTGRLTIWPLEEFLGSSSNSAIISSCKPIK